MRCPASRRLLRTLEELGGRDCALAAVRERLGVGVTNLSNIAKPLVAHGLIRRTQDPKDARNGLLSLTDLGRQALQRASTEVPEREFRDRLKVVEDVEVVRYQGRIVQQVAPVVDRPGFERSYA